MYGKIFDSIFKSTLASEGGWLPTYIFMSMITLADKDGIVDYSPKSLYSLLGFRAYDSKITFEDFKQAINYLEQEDEESNSPDENGKRVVPLKDIIEIDGNRGWLVVNYLRYRKKSSSCEPKGASTERVRRFRERQKKRGETECNGDVTEGNGHTDTDTDTDKDKELSASDDAVFIYLTKKKRKLFGKRLSSFETFWEMFGYKKGKAEAADAWLDIPTLTESLCETIFAAAEAECAARPQMIADNKTPKMAQGWITGRRWEDEPYKPVENSCSGPRTIIRTTEDVDELFAN